MSELSIREYERMINGQHDDSHAWDDTGERCLKCGDKDWFASKKCSNSKIKKMRQDALERRKNDTR